MSEYLPIIVVFVGYLGGLLVNFIVDWLYIRRQFISPECVTQITNNWLKYLLGFQPVSSCPPRRMIRVWAVNIVFAVSAWLLVFRPSPNVAQWWGLPLLLYFGVVVVMDLEYRAVLLPVSYAGLIIGLIVGVAERGWQSTLIGGAVGYAIMFGFYKLGVVFAKKMGERRGEPIEEEALGFGDVYISAIIGLLLGWPAIGLGLFIGILAGGVVSFLIMLVLSVLGRYKAYDPIPYAPFLVFGAVILMYFKDFVWGNAGAFF